MAIFSFGNSATKKRLAVEQTIGIQREAEAPNAQIRTVVRRDNINETTFFRWRNQYGGMDVSGARRIKVLEVENARLKRLVAEQLLAIDSLEELSRGKRHPRWVGDDCCRSRPVGVH